MKKVILKIDYFVDSMNMTDEEYENQIFREFEVTEDMILEMVSNHVVLRSDEVVCSDNFYIYNV